MKRNILFLLSYACFALNVSYAQSPILDSTVAITVGTLAQINVINNALTIPSGNAGPGETYDYSNLPAFNSNYTILGVDNLTSPYGNNFPAANATVSWSSFGSPFYHFQLSNSAYTYVGGGGTFGDFIYTDTYDQLRFPFSYNDTYSDSFAAVSNTGSHRLGNVIVTADGYGTLLTPNFTFLDVMRIKRESDYYDTVGGNPRHSVETYYEYYKPGIPHYILLHGFYTITSGSSNPVSGSQLFLNTNATVTGTSKQSNEHVSFSLINAENAAYIQVKNNYNYRSPLLIYNTQGQLVSKEIISISSETANISLNHLYLKAGLYLIQLQNYKGEMVTLKWNKF